MDYYTVDNCYCEKCGEFTDHITLIVERIDGKFEELCQCGKCEHEQRTVRKV